MSKVIQIRDVPVEVHTALTEAAHAQGLSLTKYVRHELASLAKRAQLVRNNTDIIRRAQVAVGAAVDRDTVLSVLDEGRKP